MTQKQVGALADLLRLRSIGPGFLYLRNPAQFVAVYRLTGGINPWVEDKATVQGKLKAFEGALQQLRPGEEVQILLRRTAEDAEKWRREYRSKIDDKASVVFRNDYAEYLEGWIKDFISEQSLCVYEAYALYTIAPGHSALMDAILKKSSNDREGALLEEVRRRGRSWCSFLGTTGADVRDATEDELVRLVYEEMNLRPFTGDPRGVLKAAMTSAGGDGFATIREQLGEQPAIFEPDHFRVGDVFGRTLFVSEFPDFEEENLFLSQFFGQKEKFKITLFAKGVDQAYAKAHIERQIKGDLATSEKGFIQNYESVAALQERQAVMDAVSRKETALIRFSLYLTVYADSRELLTTNYESFVSRFSNINRYDGYFEQKRLFLATLPFADDAARHEYLVTTGSLSNAWPVFQDSLVEEGGVPFGISAGNQLVGVDPWSSKLESWSAAVLGMAGSGKSFSVLQQIIRHLPQRPFIMIIDKSKSYEFICKAAGGSYLNIDLESDLHLNPFEYPVEDLKANKGEVSPEQVANVLGFLNVILAETGETGLKNLDNSILEEAVKRTYAASYSRKGEEAIPILSDLKDALAVMAEEKGRIEDVKALARKYIEVLKPFTGKGTYSNLTDRRTTKGIDEDSSFIVFDTSGLPESGNLLSLGIYIISQYCLTRARENRKKNRRSWLILDETWFLAKFPAGVAFLLRLAKTSRHLSMATIFATQQISDFLKNPDVKPVLDNASMKFFFKLGASEVKPASEMFELNEKETAILSGLHQSRGHYSQAFLLSSYKRGLCYVTSDTISYWLATTYPPDVLERARYVERYNPDNTVEGLWEAIFRLVNDKMNGKTLAAERK